jgi:hypothetical protein
MTTRRWIVLIAITGLICLVVHRHRSFALLAAHHESKMVAEMYPRSPIKGLPMGLGIRGPALTAEMLANSLTKGRRFIYFDRAGNAMTTDDVKAAIWHQALAPKYRHAARYPWLPVMADPPEPEWISGKAEGEMATHGE